MFKTALEPCITTSVKRYKCTRVLTSGQHGDRFKCEYWDTLHNQTCLNSKPEIYYLEARWNQNTRLLNLNTGLSEEEQWKHVHPWSLAKDINHFSLFEMSAAIQQLFGIFSLLNTKPIHIRNEIDVHVFLPLIFNH